MRDVQPEHHLAGAGTQPRVLLQHLEDQLIECAWKFGVDERRRLGCLPHERVQRADLRGGVERMPARRDLVEQDAEREDVCFRRDPFATSLFRSHVPDRAEHQAGFCRSGTGGVGGDRILVEAGETEVEQLDVPVRPHHHVLGLDVPVDDLRSVCDSQSLGDLPRDRDGPRQRNAFAGGLPQCRPFDQFHRDVPIRSEYTGLVDRHDVGVVEGGGKRGLAQQAIQRGFVADERTANHLERDASGEPRILSAIHLTHASRAELCEYFVGSDPDTGCDGGHVGNSRIIPGWTDPLRQRDGRYQGKVIGTIARVCPPELACPPVLEAEEQMVETQMAPECRSAIDQPGVGKRLRQPLDRRARRSLPRC